VIQAPSKDAAKQLVMNHIKRTLNLGRDEDGEADLPIPEEDYIKEVEECIDKSLCRMTQNILQVRY
jgi:hypothetical protein